MDKTIDCYLWMNSDWAYLGADRLASLAQRHGATVRYMPVDLPAVYARTGGVLLPLRSPERQAYRVAELRRWCRRLGVHVNPSPKFMCPDATLASCAVIAAGAGGRDIVPLYKAILHAEWCDDLDISSPQTLFGILQACGFDAGAVMALARTQEVTRSYAAMTDSAVVAGVFGSPSYVFRGELFWGQDRLDFLEEAVARAGGATDAVGVRAAVRR